MEAGEGDLSNHHQPVGKFLKDTPVPSSQEGWDQHALSQQQLDFFETNGYITKLRVLTEQQVDQLLDELEVLKKGHGLFHEFHSNESPDPSQVLMHALGAWRITQGFHDLVFHPVVAKASSQLLGNASGCVAWHQDYSYWTRTAPMAHLTIHIALDEQTIENGCLQYVPGSHMWPLLPITSRHFDDMESIRTLLNEQQLADFRPVPMLLKKGEATIHHPLLVHGSFGNKSDGPRRATVINVFADGVCSKSDEPMLAGMPVIPTDQPLKGQFFPLLYEGRRDNLSSS
ncbi:Phytanoyl-CoA dioxygenase family protein [Balamuthia mandrillaris]